MDSKFFWKLDNCIEMYDEFTDALDLINQVNDLEYVELTGSIIGNIMRYNNTEIVIIGYNKGLKFIYRQFVLFHEFKHFLEKDMDLVGFSCCDFKSSLLGDKIMNNQESICNIHGAEYAIDSVDFLNALGLPNYLAKEYWHLLRQIENIRRIGEIVDDDLLECQYDIESRLPELCADFSVQAAAAELGVSKKIFNYKVKAMEIRGMNISVPKLVNSHQLLYG